MCTALPTLASTRFPRLYELSSLVRAALINMGSVLAAKSTVETEPASIATLDMSTKLRRLALDARRARHPFLEKHPMGEFPYEAAAPQPRQASLHQLLGLCSLCRGCQDEVIGAK